VRLRGVIDRIDRDREGNLRVIDYKSGSSHLDAKDLNEGRRLQLPLYALAAQDALRMGRVTEGLYWKLFAAGAGGLKLSSYQSEAGQGPQGAFAAAQEHVARLVGAVLEGDFRPSPPQGGCPSYCQVASWCWAYQPGPVY
jgi:RecB family exonuclease